MALAANRKSPEMIGPLRSDPLATGAVIFKGSGVCLDASGNAVVPSAATTLLSRGVATEHRNQTTGDTRVQTKIGCFGFKNSASTDAITRAEIGDDCYWVDGETVAKTSATNTRSIAGKVVNIEGGLVYVNIGIGL